MRSKHQLVMRPLQLIRLCLPKDKIDSAVLLPHDTNLDTAITSHCLAITSKIYTITIFRWFCVCCCSHIRVCSRPTSTSSHAIRCIVLYNKNI